ncbi:MAG TPA: DNA repair protein RadC [Candidatus Dormibacteraeota bacterium]|jgi:DNA repair protein RadC|nr:DNA repair protein RadC [Candidatus Dormibacteraeota bacterium]
MPEVDEPGLLATLLGRHRDLSGVRALLAEGGIVERRVGDLRVSARRHGLRPAQVRRLLAVRELARRWHVPADSAAPAVTSPREALLQFQDLRTMPRECFAVLYLNTRNQPVACERVAVGGLNVASLQPREVFGPALTLGAAGVILAHNHPSGDPTPSPEDLAVTRHLQEAGRLLGVEVLDHLVICAERFRSLRESGAL